MIFMRLFVGCNKLIYRFLYTIVLILCQLVSSYAVTGPIKMIRACPGKFDNNITISWNIPPDPCGSFSGYYIYGRENSSLGWTLIDVVTFYPTNQYIHTNALNFKVNGQYFIKVNYDCDFSTPLYSDTISVNKTPPAAKIDSVSVNIYTGEIVIGWSKVNAKDVAGYTVKDFDGSGFADLSFTSSSYFLVGSGIANPQTKSYGYGIATVDSCTLESTISDPHHTIFLTATTNECYKSVSLSWNRYDGSWALGAIGWPVSKYEIYAATNFGAFIKVGETNSTTTTYTHFGQIPGDSLTFFVRAIGSGSGFTSSSNTFGHRSATKPIPQFCYVRCADVLDDGSIKLTWHPDLTGEIKKFNILRSTNGIDFSIIDSTNNDLTSEKSYTDSKVSGSSGYYYYKVLCYDLCDSVVLGSNTVRSIFIQATTIGVSTIKASWSSYGGFLNPIESYKVQRGVTSTDGTVTWGDLIETKDTLVFDNNLPDDVGEDGICYRSIAFEQGINTFGFSDSCHSNTSCARQPIIAFFANAFVPTGENPIFKPVCSFVDLKISFMVVYNRWGEEVARITDLNQGWDGKKGGKILPEGIYFYMATLYGTLNGSTKMYSGEVYLFNSE